MKKVILASVLSVSVAACCIPCTVMAIMLPKTTKRVEPAPRAEPVQPREFSEEESYERGVIAAKAHLELFAKEYQNKSRTYIVNDAMIHEEIYGQVQAREGVRRKNFQAGFFKTINAMQPK